MFYRFLVLIIKLIGFVFFRIKVVGLHNLPKSEAFILCPNHISNFDPPFVGAYIGRKVHFMAKAEAFSFKPIGKFISHLGAFPVKRSSKDITAIKHSLKLLNEGNVLCIFPEGTRSKTKKLLEGKTGASTIALKTKTPIIPVAIIGTYRLFQETTIIYGEPMSFDDLYSEKLTHEMSKIAIDRVMSEIEKLIKENQK